MATVRFFAAAADAAGIDETTVDAVRLGDLTSALVERFGPELQRVLAKSSYLIDGERTTDASHGLAPDALVDVLPPFAGG
ncbi:MoaD/ThiS family protein [Rathayibacter sp. KR2-224]|uniref:MoaD/ThiS family protein n=1 Tax=Rathayibacter sp. KR2-224 TaxID=3400913 RepID=UPI003C0872DD